MATLEVRLTVKASAADGAKLVRLVTVRSAADPTAVDVVKATVREGEPAEALTAAEQESATVTEAEFAAVAPYLVCTLG